MVITSLAATISIGKLGAASLASSARRALGCPTRIMRTPYSRAASTLPSTSGRGAWSPPMASTAIVIIGFSAQTTEHYAIRRFLSGCAFVITTVRTSLVRLLHIVAIRALAERRLVQKVVSPPDAGAPLGT